jgi:shikimate dehydrogenase
MNSGSANDGGRAVPGSLVAPAGQTPVYAVLGWPVGHSRSPAMQNAALAAAGLEGVYVAFPVAPADLEVAVRGAFALGVRGLNVTVPHKEAVVPLCAALDPVAAQVGAVNTLARVEAGWAGHNTDAPAVQALLAEGGVGAGARGLVLGAGGAARAAAWALLRLGADVAVAARRPEAAEALCRDLAAALGRPAAAARTVAWAETAGAAIHADAVVNATSVGLTGNAGRLPPLAWRTGQVALDFVYGDTEFARAARGAGARLVAGEEVLARQGELAFRIWHDRPPPAGVMARALAGAGGRA